MSDNIENTEELELELVEPAPFLRIVGTWPAVEGRAQTLELEMRLPANEEAARSWVAGFCTEVVGAMRRAPETDLVVVAADAMPRGLERDIREHLEREARTDRPARDHLPEQRDGSGAQEEGA